jgi:hypothetical protein
MPQHTEQKVTDVDVLITRRPDARSFSASQSLLTLPRIENVDIPDELQNIQDDNDEVMDLTSLAPGQDLTTTLTMSKVVPKPLVEQFILQSGPEGCTVAAISAYLKQQNQKFNTSGLFRLLTLWKLLLHL